MKVYVAIRGEYSAAQVVAVFSRAEDADKVTHAFGWDTQEFEVDALDLSPIQVGLISFNATLELTQAFSRVHPPGPLAHVHPREELPRGWDDAPSDYDKNVVHGSFWAKDQQAAQAIADAKLAEWLAKREPEPR